MNQIKLSQAELGTIYKVSNIKTNDEELNDFLFSLGCYEGENIVVVSKVSGGFVITIKDGRYNIDKQLADKIIVTQ